MRAFADHGDPDRIEPLDDRAAERVIAAGTHLDRITQELEREGVESFWDSYRKLLGCIAERVNRVGGSTGVASMKAAS